MGEDGADPVDAAFTVLVSRLLVVAVLVDDVVAPRDVSAVDGVVRKAVLLLDTVSNVVRIVLVGNSDGKDSVAAVGVIKGKDTLGVLVVVTSSKELETEDSVVAGEDSTVKRLKEKVEEEVSRVDDEPEVVLVDRSLVVDTVDDVVANSSGSERVVVMVEDASVDVDVDVTFE
ncbi:hypothetical protein CGCTS75_v013237 [Colletotrichum tropicale]|nr:hypothetical protein CGCTS75_v013237 [Colletotrichum tropicale]